MFIAMADSFIIIFWIPPSANQGCHSLFPSEVSEHTEYNWSGIKYDFRNTKICKNYKNKKI